VSKKVNAFPFTFASTAVQPRCTWIGCPITVNGRRTEYTPLRGFDVSTPRRARMTCRSVVRTSIPSRVGASKSKSGSVTTAS